MELVKLLLENDKMVRTICRQDEDMVQTIYLRAIGKQFDPRHEKSLMCWIKTVRRNEIIRLWRRSKYTSISTEGLIFDAPERERPDTELSDEMTRALDILPENYRKVIILQVVYEMSIKEISKLLKIPQGTAMTQAYRARNLMRKVLNG